MADISIGVDDAFFPNAEKELRTLRALRDELIKIEQLKDIGFNFKTPPTSLKKDLQDTVSTLRELGVHNANSYKVLGSNLSSFERQYKSRVSDLSRDLQRKLDSANKASVEMARGMLSQMEMIRPNTSNTSKGNAAVQQANKKIAASVSKIATEAAKASTAAEQNFGAFNQSTKVIASAGATAMKQIVVSLQKTAASTTKASTSVDGMMRAMAGSGAAYKGLQGAVSSASSSGVAALAAAANIAPTWQKGYANHLLRSYAYANYKGSSFAGLPAIGTPPSASSGGGAVPPGGGVVPPKGSGGRLPYSAHSAMRGAMAASGALFMSYGSMPYLAAAYGAVSGVKNSISNYATLDQQLRFSQAVAEDYSVSIEDSMNSVIATSRRFATGQMEVAQAIQALTQAGVSAREALSMVNDTMALAVTGEMDAKEAAVTLASATQAFGYSFSESARVADVFAKAAAISSSSVQDITVAMKQASSVAQGYGIQVEQVGVVMAALGKRNITGSAAGTAFRNLITEIAAPRGKAQEWQDKLGLSFYDNMTGKPKDLLNEFLPQLRSKLAGMDESLRARVIAEMFNERSRRLVATLLTLSQKQIDQLTESMQNSAGYAMEVAYIKNDNLAGQWKALVADVNAAFTNAGSAGADNLSEAIDHLRSTVNSQGFRDGLSFLVSSMSKLTSVASSAMHAVSELHTALRGWAKSTAHAVAAATGLNNVLDQMGSEKKAEGLSQKYSGMAEDLLSKAKEMNKAKEDQLLALQQGQGAVEMRGLDERRKLLVDELKVVQARKDAAKAQVDAILSEENKSRQTEHEARNKLRERAGHVPLAPPTKVTASDLLSSPTLMHGLFNRRFKAAWGALASAERAEAALLNSIAEGDKAREAYKAELDRGKGLGQKVTDAQRKHNADPVIDSLLDGLTDEDGISYSSGFTGGRGGKAKPPRVAFRVDPLGELQRVGATPRPTDAVAKYVKPYDGNYRITDDLSGWRKDQKGRPYRHGGIDVAMPIGTPLRAMADGVVQSVGSSTFGGKLISVRHDDGTIAKYMHLSGYAEGIKAGSRVLAGQKIALSGNTGRSSGPHAHIEFLRDGKRYDFRNQVGANMGAFQKASGNIVEADTPDGLLAKLSDYFGDAAKKLELEMNAKKNELERRHMLGEMFNPDEYKQEISKVEAEYNRQRGALKEHEARAFDDLRKQGGLTQDGDRQAQDRVMQAGAEAAQYGHNVTKLLYENAPYKRQIDFVQAEIQGYKDLQYSLEQKLAVQEREAAIESELNNMTEYGAAVRRAQISDTAELTSKIDDLNTVMQRLRDEGADTTPAGAAALAQAQTHKERLQGDIKRIEARSATTASKKWLQDEGSRLSSSFADALMSENASQSIRQWIIEEVLAKPFKMQLELLLKPIMEQLAGFLNMGADGNGAGGWIGSLIDFGLGLFGGGGGAEVATQALGTSYSGALFNSSLYGFANGGIMTKYGAVPLRKYANGGIATSPQLALYGEGSTPEAYVPLPDGRTIPVTMEGSTGGMTSNNVSITINHQANGSSTSSQGGDTAGNLGQFGKIISGMVQQELIKQSRSGGLLAGK